MTHWWTGIHGAQAKAELSTLTSILDSWHRVSVLSQFMVVEIKSSLIKISQKLANNLDSLFKWTDIAEKVLPNFASLQSEVEQLDSETAVADFEESEFPSYTQKHDQLITKINALNIHDLQDCLSKLATR
jgi:hypothetical protein